MSFYKIVFIAFLFVTPFAQAQLLEPVHGFTAEQNEIMVQANSLAASKEIHNNVFDSLHITPGQAILTRPFAEYTQAGYLIVSDGEQWGSGDAKMKMAKNLPADMTMVIYTQSSDRSYHQELYNKYAKVLDSKRLKVIALPYGGVSFWARDGVPVPVYNSSDEFTVVDAKYYHSFEEDRLFSEYFTANLLAHNYFYEGGNYLANSRGECIIVNNTRVAQMPDSVFKKDYGCQSMIRLDHVKGIGHVDEVVKFINDDLVITDEESYIPTLEAKGYTVVKIPEPQEKYETYVNSLIINGTAFVPVFNEPADQSVLDTYKSFGLKVVPLNSKSLSVDGKGSIHCITMVYPPTSFNTVLKAITKVVKPSKN